MKMRPPVRKPRVKKNVVEKVVRERPSLFENNPEPAHVETTADETSSDPDETQAIPWSPRFSSAAERELAEEVDQPTFGRLLGRAFGQTNKGN